MNFILLFYDKFIIRLLHMICLIYLKLILRINFINHMRLPNDVSNIEKHFLKNKFFK